MKIIEQIKKGIINREAYRPLNWEKVSCPICVTDEFKPYEKYGDQLQYTYVLCNNCKLVYQNPRPKYDEEFINSAYGQYFVFDDKHDHKLYNGQDFYKELIEIREFDKSLSCLLDIGSSMGDFLFQAKKFYKDVEGVEIGKNMAEFTEKQLNIKVHTRQFDILDVSKKYSCIHLSHVIEHIPNPNLWLQKAKEILAKNGILVIAVPNMFSLTRLFKIFLKRIGLRKGKWKESWRTPDHLFEPTIESMKYLFDQNGFEILSYYSYSRKDLISKKLLNSLFYRYFKLGSNLRFYVTPKKYF